MIKHWRPFTIGAVFMLVLLVGGYILFAGQVKSLITPPAKLTDTAYSADKDALSDTAIPSDAVLIMPLPSLQVIRGNGVPFEGKTEFRQAIAGRFAQNIVIVNFQATGEHAEKSAIKIVWENGEVEKVFPGTRNRKFSTDKRAVEISVLGYSMHERHIFKDSSSKGTLSWEIHCEPVES